MRNYDSARDALGSRYPLIDNAIHVHQTERNEAISFTTMPYLVELYVQLYLLRFVAIRKAVQTGVSELCIQLAARKAGWDGRTCCYVLPRDRQRDRFVQKRVNPMIRRVPAYRALTVGGLGPDADIDPTKGHKSSVPSGASNLSLKAFGEGTLIFLGGNTPNNFVEFSTDLLIIDEMDRCDQAALALAPDRLKASPHPQEIYIGNPTIPNVGISELFEDGDQRLYHWACHCGELQPLDWFVNVVRKLDDGSWEARDEAWTMGCGRDMKPTCRVCKEPFHRHADGSRWIPTNPKAYYRSYGMSRLDVLTQRIDELFLKWLKVQNRTELLTAFYNSDLGIPYETFGTGITTELIDRCSIGASLDHAGGEALEEEAITCGIDVGSEINIVISKVVRVPLPEGLPGTEFGLSLDDDEDSDAGYYSGDDDEDEDEDEELGTYVRRDLIWAGTVRSFEAVEDKLEQYRVDIVVIDHAPEVRKAQELRDSMMVEGIQVWLCRYYKAERTGREEYAMSLNEDANVVSVDRTQLLDAARDDMAATPLRRVFPEDITTVEHFMDQMIASKRVLNEKGTRYIWDEGSKADHYRHADAYDRVAYDLFQTGAAYLVMDD